MDLALYHPVAGFYARGGGAGRGGDFLTSPELGSLFGAVLARAFDRWWSELGQPDPFVVVEAGAGVGSLAQAVLAARPACLPALHYVLVERAQALRAQQGRRLQLEPPRQVLGPVVRSHFDDEGAVPAPGTGPVVCALGELPSVSFVGLVVANELLDNLPVRLLERSRGRWEEVRVGENEAGSLTEVLVPAEPELEAEAQRFAPEAPEAARIPLQHAAIAWLRQALGILVRGRLVVFDYVDVTPSLALRPWRQWLRTYRRQGRGKAPLEDLGLQDVTCEVAVDQLAAVRPPTSNRPQAEFLGAHGIDDLARTAQAAWQERAHLGDLKALAAASRVTEARALTDPGGLGGFRVLEWEVRP